MRYHWFRVNTRRLAITTSAALALVAALVAGCGGTVTTPQSPGALNLDIKVKYYQQGASPVEAHFTTNGSTVEFVSGETVACDGTFLAYDSNPVEHLFDYGSYTGDVAMQPASGTYTFTYTPAQGKGSPISIPVPVVNAPVDVTSPAPGAAVALPTNGQPVTIQYTPTQLANTTILAILSDSRGTFTFTLPQSETGTISVPANQLSKFQPGPGTIDVVRITTTQVNGTPFHQVTTEFDNITVRQMTWQ